MSGVSPCPPREAKLRPTPWEGLPHTIDKRSSTQNASQRSRGGTFITDSQNASERCSSLRSDPRNSTPPKNEAPVDQKPGLSVPSGTPYRSESESKRFADATF